MDGLVVEGGEGGGFKNPDDVSTLVLLQAVREQTDVPIIAAGGICDGRGMAAAFALGAEGIQMGTRFVSAAESPVHANYKQAIVDAHANDIVYSNYFTGIHGNYLKPSILAAGMDPDHLPEADPSKMDFDKATTGAKAWKDIWGCGQGIGAVKAVEPVAAETRSVPTPVATPPPAPAPPPVPTGNSKKSKAEKIFEKAAETAQKIGEYAMAIECYRIIGTLNDTVLTKDKMIRYFFIFSN